MTFKTCCYCLSLRTGCILIISLDLLIIFLYSYFLHNMFDWKISMLLEVIYSTAVGLLIYGVIKKQSTFLWCWIYFKIIIISFIALGVLLAVMTLIMKAVARKWDYMTPEIMFIGVISVLAVHVVLIIVVYSFDRELCKNREYQTNDSGANIVSA